MDPAIAGDYFTSDTGQCTDPSIPVSDLQDRFCESFPARATRTCDIFRRVWVDRTDFYRCDKRAANYVKVCQKNVTRSCTVWDNNDGCVQRNVRFYGAQEFWWEGRNAVVTVRGPSDPASAGIFGLTDANISMQISDHFKSEQVILRRVHVMGGIDVSVNGGAFIQFPNFFAGNWNYEDTYKFLSPHRYGDATPGTGKRWAVSNLRILTQFNAFLNGNISAPQSHTYARVWIEFSGACCDAFSEQGTELCE